VDNAVVTAGASVDRTGYLRQFADAAARELADLAARRAVQIARPRLSGDGAVHAETMVTFRGRRFSYRRKVWPSEHCAAFQAGLYATFLEEKLLTTPLPADGTGDVIPL
jgi:hypothetical protein